MVDQNPPAGLHVEPRRQTAQGAGIFHSNHIGSSHGVTQARGSILQITDRGATQDQRTGSGVYIGLGGARALLFTHGFKTSTARLAPRGQTGRWAESRASRSFPDALP